MRDPVAPVDLASLAAAQARSGALWRLDGDDLQANLVRLGAGDCIQPHRNHEVEVVVVVISGHGELTRRRPGPPAGPDGPGPPAQGDGQGNRGGRRPLADLSIHRRQSAGLQVGRPAQRR